MNSKAKIEVPGEVALPGMPGATDQPPTAANAEKIAATEAAVPESLTLEQMQAALFRLTKQVDEQNAVIAQQSAGMAQAAPQLKPVSQADAEKKAAEHVEKGEVPPAMLTEQGWFVHALSHSSAKAVEEEAERNEKHAAKKSAKKAEA